MFTWDTLPEQPFGSPPKNFKGSQKHFGGDLGTVGALPGRFRVALASSWFHFGAILEPCWRVSSTTVAKGHFPSVCQSSVLKDVTNEITIHRGPGQICRGGGEGKRSHYGPFSKITAECQPEATTAWFSYTFHRRMLPHSHGPQRKTAST